MNRISIAAVLLSIASCIQSEPVEPDCLPPVGEDEVCSPERPNGRIGCTDEEGACTTYDCCLFHGCGPKHFVCDCCDFLDAPGDCDED